MLQRWINHYLASDAFRQRIIASIAKNLDADQVSVAPMRWDGTSLFCEAMTVNGFYRGSLEKIDVNGLRATLNLRAILKREWHVRKIEARRLEIVLDDTRALRAIQVVTAPAPPAPEPTDDPAVPEMPLAPPPVPEAAPPSLLPTRVVWDEAIIQETYFSWTLKNGDKGQLAKAHVEVRPEEGGVLVQAKGGQLQHQGFPVVSLNQANLRYRNTENKLYVTSAAFDMPQGGVADLSGEIDLNPGSKTQLLIDLQRVQAGPLLAEDWRARFDGELSGRIRIETFPDQPVAFQGPIEIKNANLHALPILNQISLFTGMREYRNLQIQNASGNLSGQGESLQMEQIVIESEGLLKVTGAFQVHQGLLTGNLRVGVTQRSLQWLPGARERVFTEQEGAYYWTNLQLSGTAKSPKEDLSGRLAAAVAGKIFDSTGDAVENAGEKASELIQEASDLLNRFLRP